MRVGSHHELIALGLEILGATIERYLKDLVLVVGGAVDVDLAFAVEQIRHRIRRSEVPAEAGELVADLGYGPGCGVAQSGYEYRDASAPVPFVLDFSVVNALELSGSFLYRALDVLLGHRLGFGGVDRRA